MKKYIFRIKGTTGDKLWFYLDLLELAKGNETIAMDMMDEETLGEWTGLRDKHANKIYEGDILEYSSGARVTVAFRDGAYAGELNGQEGKGGWRVCELTLKEGDKVIGNVYDNPELLI